MKSKALKILTTYGLCLSVLMSAFARPVYAGPEEDTEKLIVGAAVVLTLLGIAGTSRGAELATKSPDELKSLGYVRDSKVASSKTKFIVTATSAEREKTESKAGSAL